MSSSACQAMIDKYEGYKGQISGVISNVESCITELSSGNQIVEQIIVNGKPIDDGLLSNLASSLSGLIGILNTLISECDAMIAKYTTLKAQALAREAAMRKAREESDEAFLQM